MYTRQKGVMMLIIMLMIALSAGMNPVETKAQNKVVLQFMGWEASPFETEGVMNGLKHFMELNPDIEVKYIAGRWAEHHTKLLTMMAGGAAPDVFFLGAEPFYREFQKRGVLLDITSYFNSEFKISDFIPMDRQKMVINGRIYGVSSCVVAPVLYYNKELFNKAGVSYPSANPEKAWTWEKFLEAAKKLTVKEGDRTIQFGVYGLETYPIPFIWSNGGDIFNKNYSECILPESPKAKEALVKILDLRNKYGVSPDAFYLTNVGMSPNQMLQTGKIGMLVDGSWALQELARMKFPVGVGVLPKFKTPVTHGTAHLHAIWKGTKHPKEAWRLVSFLSSEEYQLYFVRDGLWMPNRMYLYTKDGIKKWLNPSVHPAGFEEIADYFTKYLRPHPAIFIPQEAWDIVNEELDKFWHADQPIDKVAQEMAQRVNPILKTK